MAGKSHGHAESDAGGLHAGQGTHVLYQVTIKTLAARLAVTNLMRVKHDGEDVIGIEAQIHPLSVAQAANEQSSDHQQHQ